MQRFVTSPHQAAVDCHIVRKQLILSAYIEGDMHLLSENRGSEAAAGGKNDGGIYIYMAPELWSSCFTKDARHCLATLQLNVHGALYIGV